MSKKMEDEEPSRKRKAPSLSEKDAEPRDKEAASKKTKSRSSKRDDKSRSKKKKKRKDSAPEKTREEEEDQKVPMEVDNMNFDDDEDDGVAPSDFLSTRRDKGVRTGDECPYLDTINRKTVDFDFEKVCSVSMTKHNVYCCLVCGDYFNGRSKDTHAYYHALHVHHHIFIHLHNGKIYCLPDGYEVDDPSLADIKHNLHPAFTKKEIRDIDQKAVYSHALDGSDYLPGMIGINNLGSTDWLNAVVQSLMRIKPLRNFFIDESNTRNLNSILAASFGEFVRKFFNRRAFKGQISPHELLEVIRDCSNKRFAIGTHSDAKEFCTWFLDSLHVGLGGKRKSRKRTSIIDKVLQGQVIIHASKDEALTQEGKKPPQPDKNARFGVEECPFTLLTLQLPNAPLFRSDDEEQFIPQVPMTDLLKKFDGSTPEANEGVQRTYLISRLPQYLIIHMKRFQENNFYVERNPTIVNFPIKNLDFANYTITKAKLKTIYSQCSVAELRKKLQSRKIDSSKCVEKSDLVQKVVDSYTIPTRTRYNLIANIVHQGEWAKGSNKAYVHHVASRQWYEAQDLHVTETMPQLVAVSESYIQVWQLQKEGAPQITPTSTPRVAVEEGKESNFKFDEKDQKQQKTTSQSSSTISSDQSSSGVKKS